MSELQLELVDSEEFIPVCDYDFTGDNYTAERKRTFVEAYREEGSIYHAAIAAKVSRKTIYNWFERDPAFVSAVQDSKEDCSDQVETSVYKKAIAGSTLDAIFYLKAKRPEFRDRVTLDLNAMRDELQGRLQRHLSPQTPLTLQSAKKDNE